MDPVGFAREALGACPWEKQCEILEAVRDNDRVAVRSGHKVGKSNTAALLALWFYSSFEDARVVLSSTTARQVDEILWREVGKVISRAHRARDAALTAGTPTSLIHIDGDFHVLARSGLKAEDFRQIVGFTAKHAEAAAGVSGANLLYIIDEASGVPDLLFEAIEGNRAGGAKIILFSNPTQTTGEFFRAFSKAKAKFYHCIAISSEETPNCITGENVIPGLATRKWVEEKKLEWGVTSALYKVRVKGEFASESSNAVVSLALCDHAASLWETSEGLGRLHAGVDVARTGDDESIVAIRRGHKVIALRTLDLPEGAAHSPQWAMIFAERAIEIVEEYRTPREQKPLVKIDAIGVGDAVYQLLASLPRFADRIEAVSVVAFDRAPGELASRYERVRDCMWFGMRDWMREGGTIPDDGKLQEELIAPEVILHASGLMRVTPKDDLRDALKRSTDRADAVMLSIWSPAIFEPPPHEPDPPRQLAPGGPPAGQTYWEPEDTIDAYGGTIDAYGGRGPYR